MSRNGSGLYSLPAPPSPFTNGTTINATDMMAVLNDIASALTGSVAADGQTVASALPISDGTEKYTFSVSSKNLTITDTTAGATRITVSSAGAVTIANATTISSGGLTIAAGGAAITGTTSVTGGPLQANNNITCVGTISATGAVSGGSLSTAGGVTAGGTLGVTGAATVGGTLAVTGVATAANGTTGTQVVNYSQFPATLTATGQITFPNGLIEKWGSGTYTAGAGSVSFGTAFPTACLNVQITLATSGSPHTSYPPGPSSITASGFHVDGGTGQAGSFYWRAIGY